MLRKLLKYEFIAVGRILLPVYGILILLSGLFRLSSMIRTEMTAASVINVLLMVLYILFAFAVFFITIAVLLRRYYTNLYGDQGYLTLTLPATPLAHLLTKLISALLFSMAGIAVGVLSIFIASSAEINEIRFSDLAAIWREILAETHASFVWLLFISMIGFILMVYAAISLGQLSNHHRVGASVLAFFIIEAIENILQNILDMALPNMYYVNWTEKSILAAIFALLCFLICYWQLSRKVNLQ